MTDLPAFTDLYRELSETYDALLAVDEDPLKPSPSRRPPRRDPDERQAPAGGIRKPTEDVVFDERRLALARRREEALRVIDYLASRLPDVRSNLRAAHEAWLGESDVRHTV